MISSMTFEGDGQRWEEGLKVESLRECERVKEIKVAEPRVLLVKEAKLAGRIRNRAELN